MKAFRICLPLLGAALLCWSAQIGLASSKTATFVNRSLDDHPSESVEEMLDRVGNYVQRLEEHLAVVISDETYVQNVWERHHVVISRTIRSEMLFMWLSQEDIWLSIRNVLAVDGRPIPDSSGRLDRALAAPGFDYMSQLRQLKAESARFDVGQVWRTTGNPNVVLRFLLPGNQTHFSFTQKGQERIRGETVSKLAFAEHERPTAIDFNGEDVLSDGAIWVRPSDGTVVRTNLKLSTPTRMAVTITVDFQRDPKLDLWVPLRMEERYDDYLESTTCAARYSNFRRFETSGRLISPK
jgi:hypothetical protein